MPRPETRSTTKIHDTPVGNDQPMRQGDGRSGKEPQVPPTTETAEKKFGSPFEGVQATVKAIFGGDKAKVPTPPALEEDAGGAAADTVEDAVWTRGCSRWTEEKGRALCPEPEPEAQT